MHRLTCSQKCNCPSSPCVGIREQQLVLGPLPLLTSNFALNFLLLPLYDLQLPVSGRMCDLW